MDRNKKIINNTIIFAIGNFGSKVLTYVMVLIYTHYINASDLGYYDLILTTMNLLHPLILVAFDEGIYLWLIDKEKANKKVIISTCIKTTFITSIISTGLLFILNIHFYFRNIAYIALFIITTMIYQMFLNAVRGLSNNKLYAISGILNSFIILIFELGGLILFSQGVECLLISKSLANCASIVIIYFSQKEFRGFIKEKFDSVLCKQVLSYSAPLIPNQVSWWVVNSSDRYIILWFLGTSFNGIYSISNKFPTIITTITGIVYFALQETIIKEYHADDIDEFYSQTFKKYYSLLFSLIMCAVPATNLVIKWFVSLEYIDAWKYTGFLCLSTVFSALSSFLGIGYQISRETKRSVLSTISAAGINIVINIIFIKKIGLHAASLSTFVSYLSLFIIRIIHSKKYFNLHIDWRLFGRLVTASNAVIIASYYGNIAINVILTIISTFAILIGNRSILLSFIKKKGIKNGSSNNNSQCHKKLTRKKTNSYTFIDRIG